MRTTECPFCRDGKQQVDGLFYPCEDCEGGKELFFCVGCEHWKGPSAFEESSELCRTCIDDAELGLCPTCETEAYVDWGSYGVLAGSGHSRLLWLINCMACSTQTETHFEKHDALAEWREMQNKLTEVNDG